ncbi:fumarylacetoacetate hydrolase family protein [Brevibacterium metallidurans]|uniref:Fumarylacetoacetate hydrolase family protein n=1 Tax=Brevibacterium metallidurans TaxID=1482676 RepID=A0ABN0SNT3_9MICO
MRLMRIGARDAETPILEVGDSHFDLSAVVDDIDPSFWADGPARITTALKAGTLPEIDIAGQRIGAPIARPASVICIGQNYAAHAAESGSPAPTQPIIFLKTPNTITGPFDDIGIPPRAATFDWEVELGVVIGAQAAYLESPEAARAVIGGYLVANDLSERDYQTTHSGGQWSKGKVVKDSMPLGPYLVTADAIDPRDLRLRSWVNGDPRQDSTTADMIFPVDDLVWRLSQYMQLEPGDIISTGTPQGVALSGLFPYLQPGDVSEVEITGLGRQRQTYFRVDAPAGTGADLLLS